VQNLRVLSGFEAWCPEEGTALQGLGEILQHGVEARRLSYPLTLVPSLARPYARRTPDSKANT
jgi:hypothetical protein